MDEQPILPMPLFRWPNYASFNDSRAFEAILAACATGITGAHGGCPFLHARTDHLEHELVEIRTVLTGSEAVVWCYAGLRRSQPVVEDLGRRLHWALEPAPQVITRDWWTLYSWPQLPRLKPQTP